MVRLPFTKDPVPTCWGAPLAAAPAGLQEPGAAALPRRLARLLLGATAPRGGPLKPAGKHCATDSILRLLWFVD